MTARQKPSAAAPKKRQATKAASAVKEHKYQVGQVVDFTPGALTLETSIGKYEIVRHLPPEGPENQYRIKSVLDSHERVVRESQIA
jgi:hypothetical protein